MYRMAIAAAALFLIAVATASSVVAQSGGLVQPDNVCVKHPDLCSGTVD